MSLLVYGKTGQVAQALQTCALGAVFADRAQADFTEPDACAALVARLQPDAVINAVAYTGVDAAETDEARATVINADTPGAIARACAAAAIPMIHISTDYVFDGSGSMPFAPDHPTAPLGAYGRSKLAGERAVRAAGGPHAILRTSWVVSATGANFVTTMLRLGATHDVLNIVADQIGGPTCADDIAHACLEICAQLGRDPGKTGTYHYAGAPAVSWADFARAIFYHAGLDVQVTDIPAAQYPTPATRPANSHMDMRGTQTTFGIDPPDWVAGLRRILRALDSAVPPAT